MPKLLGCRCESCFAVYWKSDRPVQVSALMSEKDAYELDQVCLVVDAEFVEHLEFKWSDLEDVGDVFH